MPGQPTVIYSAASTQQAHLLKGLLAAQGINAWVVNDAIQLAGGDLPLGWAAAARVVVSDEDAAAARALAEEFDRQTAHEPTADEAPASELPSWEEWPVCPVCSEKRSARCPVCGLSRQDFPLADIQQSGDEERVFLKCEDCDDVFVPEWFRFCPRCGHDYGNGIHIDRPAARRVEYGARLATVMALLLAAGIVISAYFVWLFGWRGG
jgi:uncharacterized paraquat-inducible protein A